jgi:ubiquinone/menaquinone biosynthesis C-methylase UbiE
MYGDASERFAIADRVLWQRPAEVIAALHVGRGDRVLDVGSGSGDFAIPLACAVGSEGIVYAIDREPAYVHDLARRIRGARLSIDARVSSLEAFVIDEPLDLAFLSNTLHQIADRAGAAKALRSMVRKRRGRVAIIDWKKGSSLGPSSSAKITERHAIAMFERAGFRLDERLAFLPEQFFLIFSA